MGSGYISKQNLNGRFLKTLLNHFDEYQNIIDESLILRGYKKSPVAKKVFTILFVY